MKKIMRYLNIFNSAMIATILIIMAHDIFIGMLEFLFNQPVEESFWAISIVLLVMYICAIYFSLIILLETEFRLETRFIILILGIKDAYCFVKNIFSKNTTPLEIIAFQNILRESQE